MRSDEEVYQTIINPDGRNGATAELMR